MANYLLGFPNKKERDDFYIAIVVILFFISLFWYFLGRGDGPQLDTSLVPVAEVVAEDIDSDMDGVFDANDNCPNRKGSAENNGCPMDSDNDGVYDEDDECPRLVGTLANKGCPNDSDGDGIYDNKDECPNISFPSKTGCPPDADGDGVFDADDKCPNVAGTAENDGCPFTEDERATIQEIQSSVEFENARAILLPSSRSKMDQLVGLLNKYPTIKMKIHGHTDANGDADRNLSLSANRADACMAYLVSKGISPSRLRTRGYGETKPIATNDTKEGRQRNRRVEFLSF